MARPFLSVWFRGAADQPAIRPMPSPGARLPKVSPIGQAEFIDSSKNPVFFAVGEKQDPKDTLALYFPWYSIFTPILMISAFNDFLAAC
jgi:hypothetical protein